MKRLFIGSILLLSTSLFLTGCVTHTPISSVHVVKTYPVKHYVSHYDKYYDKRHDKHHKTYPTYNSYSTVKVYHSPYPKSTHYKPKPELRHEPYHLNKHQHDYVAPRKHMKPQLKPMLKPIKTVLPNSKHNKPVYSHSQPRNKIIKSKNSVKVVKKNRLIIVNNPRKQTKPIPSIHTRHANKNIKQYKNRKESQKQDVYLKQEKQSNSKNESKKDRNNRENHSENIYSKR
ncbi:MAG TPA: hypothetical protein ENK73_07815 [Thiomicrospira sp.]|nr:hypothetical protein [Thiomicrospira sp.]